MKKSTSSSCLKLGDEGDIPCSEELLPLSTADFQLAAYKLFWHHCFLHVITDPLIYLKDLHFFVKVSLSLSLKSKCFFRIDLETKQYSHYISNNFGGRQEAGTDLAEFCAHALLALQPLIHPHSLPYAATPAVTTTSMAIDRPTQGNMVSHIQNADGVPSVPDVSVSMSFGDSLNDVIYQDEYMGWVGNIEDSAADLHHLYNNTEMPTGSLVEMLTDNRVLQCSPLEDITRMASQHYPVNDKVLHSIPVEGLPASPIKTDKPNPMDMCEANNLRIDGTQELMVSGSGSETICLGGLSLPESARQSVKDLTYKHPTTRRPDVVSSSRDTMLAEAATPVHMVTLAIEATDSAVAVSDPYCETFSSAKMDCQPVENLSVPLAVKPSTFSSTAESDSDAIPDIVDGYSDTE
eukprot:Gb_24484 [translate_table: standard]